MKMEFLFLSARTFFPNDCLHSIENFKVCLETPPIEKIGIPQKHINRFALQISWLVST